MSLPFLRHRHTEAPTAHQFGTGMTGLPAQVWKARSWEQIPDAHRIQPQTPPCSNPPILLAVSNIHVHALDEMYSPILASQTPQGPPKNLTGYMVESSLKVNKGEVKWLVCSNVLEFLKLASLEPQPGTKPSYIKSMSTILQMKESSTRSSNFITWFVSFRPW